MTKVWTRLWGDGERVLGVEGVVWVDGGADDVLAAREEHEGLGHGARRGGGGRGLLAVGAGTPGKQGNKVYIAIIISHNLDFYQ